MGRKPNKSKKENNLTLDNNLKNRKEILKYTDGLILLTTKLDAKEPVSYLSEMQLKYSEILKKLITIEKNNNEISNIRSKESLTQFMTYMKENGAKFENIDLEFFPNYGLGVKTLTKLDADKLTITIPRKLMLTEENAKNSILSELITKDPILEGMPNVALALFLILEKYNNNSFWGPYFKVLPEKYSTCLYYTNEELAELKGSSVYESAFKQIKNITRQYAYFKRLFFTTDTPVARIMRACFTYEEYRWAVSTVMTRQNEIPSSSGSGMILALIPLWDMINHSNGAMTTEFNVDENQSEYYSLSDYQPGEQIFMCYGRRHNSDLFLYNGFVYPENTYDFYVLQIPMLKDLTKLPEAQIVCLEKVNLPLIDFADYPIMFKKYPIINTFKITPKPIGFDATIINFTKIWLMSETQLQTIVNIKDKNEFLGKLKNMGADMDEKAINFLKIRFQVVLRSYPTTLEEDEKMLTETDLSEHVRNAILLRASEKRIIKENLEILGQPSIKVA